MAIISEWALLLLITVSWFAVGYYAAMMRCHSRLKRWQDVSQQAIYNLTKLIKEIENLNQRVSK